MNTLHPSPTAGDGQLIEQSANIKRVDKFDRIINCAQCGFPVSLDKRATGDSLGSIGNPSISSETVTPRGGKANTYNYGDPVDTNSGCPFCNSMNPQGRLRNKIPGSSVNLENL